jgi:hypothetical protein
VEVTARFVVADVFDGLASLETGSVDLVVTSPPFLALRSYLPADHPDEGKEIGSEATPAEFIDVLLKVTQELRRVLAPHGSICVELGDTYAGSGGGGGDYYEGGMREGQPGFTGSALADREAIKSANAAHWRQKNPQKNQGSVNLRHGVTVEGKGRLQDGPGWPLSKSKTLIPELYRIALAYGFNPLTGTESPAGKWRVRNNVTWCRPNPPVGALGDKWRPATSDLVVACMSGKRYWDDLATRQPAKRPEQDGWQRAGGAKFQGAKDTEGVGFRPEVNTSNPSGAPLLDYWEIPPTGYSGSHYAVFPPALVEPLVKAMVPPKVCRECGEPSRRIVAMSEEYRAVRDEIIALDDPKTGMLGYDKRGGGLRPSSQVVDQGWTDCGHDNYRPALILDPFAGSGTTGLVATGYGHDAVLIDIDERNAELAMERVGPFLMEIV